MAGWSWIVGGSGALGAYMYVALEAGWVAGWSWIVGGIGGWWVDGRKGWVELDSGWEWGTGSVGGIGGWMGGRRGWV